MLLKGLLAEGPVHGDPGQGFAGGVQDVLVVLLDENDVTGLERGRLVARDEGAGAAVPDDHARLGGRGGAGVLDDVRGEDGGARSGEITGAQKIAVVVVEKHRSARGSQGDGLAGGGDVVGEGEIVARREGGGLDGETVVALETDTAVDGGRVLPRYRSDKSPTQMLPYASRLILCSKQNGIIFTSGLRSIIEY